MLLKQAGEDAVRMQDDVSDALALSYNKSHGGGCTGEVETKPENIKARHS